MIGSILLPLTVIVGYASPCNGDTVDDYTDDKGAPTVLVACSSEFPRVHRNWDGSRAYGSDVAEVCSDCYSAESSLWDTGDSTECRNVACTEYEVTVANGYVYCQDNDQAYQPGQWTYTAGEVEDMAYNRQSFGYVTVAW